MSEQSPSESSRASSVGPGKPKKKWKVVLQRSLFALAFLVAWASFPFVRTCIYPLIYLVQPANLDLSEYCPVYTTKEKPMFRATFSGANRYRYRIFPKVAFAKSTDWGNLADISPILPFELSMIKPALSRSAVIDEWGFVVPSDWDHGTHAFVVNQKLPKGDYVLVAEAFGDLKLGKTTDTQWAPFRITDLGLIVKRDCDKVFVRAIDLTSLTARKGGSVSFNISDGSKSSFLASGHLDGNGQATFKRPAVVSLKDWSNLAVAATDSEDYAFAGNYWVNIVYKMQRNNIETNEWNEYGHFGHEHRSNLMFDRPLYRLGQTVFFKGSVRTLTTNGLQNEGRGLSLKMVVRDPNYQEMFTRDLATNDYGEFDGSFKLSPTQSTGNYDISLQYGNNDNDEFHISVEQYRKPEYNVRVEPLTPHVVAGEKAKIRILANYYFGAPVQNATVSYTVHSMVDYENRNRVLGKPKYSYFYDSWNLEGDYHPYFSGNDFETSGTAHLDQNGQAIVEVATQKSKAVGDTPESYDFADRSLLLTAQVTDLSLKTAEGSGDAISTRGNFAVFVKPKHHICKSGEPVEAEIKAVSYEGKPIPHQKLNLHLDKWNQKLLSSKYEQVVLDKTSCMTDENGIATVTLPTKNDFSTDTYYVVADTTDSAANLVGDASRVWVVGADNSWLAEEASPLTIQLDKPVYTYDQTARVIVKAPVKNGEQAELLLTIEGNQLHDARVVKMNGPVQMVEIPLRKSYAPNVFIVATYVDNAHKPYSANAMLGVSPDFHFIKTEITSDKKVYRPGESVQLKLKATDTAGRPVSKVACALSVGDQSICDLAADESASDIYHSIYSQFSNWVTTAFSFTEPHQVQSEKPALVDPNGPALVLGLLMGGGSMMMSEHEDRFMAAKAPSEIAALPPPALPAPAQTEAAGGLSSSTPKPSTTGRLNGGAQPHVRSSFADTAGWFPNLITDANGIATAKFKLPDDLTTWKVSASGITTGSDVTAAESAVMVSQDFIARLALPRFYTQNDEGFIAAVIHNYSSRSQPVKASLTTTKQFSLLEPPDKSVQIGANTESRLTWKIKVIKDGAASVTLKAVGDTAGDALQIKLPVRPLAYRAFFAKAGIMKNDKESRGFPIKLPPDAVLTDGHFDLSMSASSIGPVIGSFEKLIEYPYGCTEQTLSRLVPSTVAMKLHKQLGVALGDQMEKKFQTVYDIAMPKLTEYQHNDGGWGWWKTDESNPYLTAHVLEGLHSLKEAGYAVDDAMVKRGLDYLHLQTEAMFLNSWNSDLASDHARAIYVLSLYNIAVSPAAVVWQTGNLHRLTPEGLSYLVLAFKKNKNESAARQAYQRLLTLSNTSNDYIDWDHTPELNKKINGSKSDWDYTYKFTGVETTALGLRAVIAMEPNNERLVEPISQWIIAQRDENGWNNTKCTAEVLVALMEKEIAISKGRKTDFAASIVAGSKLIQMIKFQQQVEAGQKSFSCGLVNAPSQFDLKKEGPGWLYYSSLLEYDRPLKPGQDIYAKSIPGDLKLKRELFKLERYQPGQKITERQTAGTHDYKPVPLSAAVKAGDLIMMRVTVDSPISAPYVMVDAALPSGGEVVKDGVNVVEKDEKGLDQQVENYGWWTHEDVLDDRVAFFCTKLPTGKSRFTAIIRMEQPGKFNMNPVTLQAMYTKNIRAYTNADSVAVVQ